MVIHAIHIFSEDVLEVVFSYVDEDASKGKKTNIFIAAFTTAQACLKFYSYLDPLRDQVLYYDTDSNIFIAAFTTAQARLKFLQLSGSLTRSSPLLRHRFRHLLMQTRPNHDHTRRFLSNMTSELNEDGYITEFISGSARNYGYLTKQGKS